MFARAKYITDGANGAGRTDGMVPTEMSEARLNGIEFQTRSDTRSLHPLFGNFPITKEP
jgi:hypothetical protein